MRYSQQAGGRYLMDHYNTCGALQGDDFLYGPFGAIATTDTASGLCGESTSLLDLVADGDLGAVHVPGAVSRGQPYVGADEVQRPSVRSRGCRGSLLLGLGFGGGV